MRARHAGRRVSFPSHLRVTYSAHRAGLHPLLRGQASYSRRSIDLQGKFTCLTNYTCSLMIIGFSSDHFQMHSAPFRLHHRNIMDKRDSGVSAALTLSVGGEGSQSGQSTSQASTSGTDASAEQTSSASTSSSITSGGALQTSSPALSQSPTGSPSSSASSSQPTSPSSSSSPSSVSLRRLAVSSSSGSSG